MISPAARRVLAPAVVVITSLALYAPGLGWGLPALVSWSQDSIADVRTLGAVADWPQDWKGRYPPLHYWLLYAAYQPSLQYWQAQGEPFPDPGTSGDAAIPAQARKTAVLILIARVVSVVMAVMAVLGVYATCIQLTDDRLAASGSALAFLIGADFTYFAHLDNVDAPSICWFAWSAYFYVRLLREHSLSNALLLALFAALAVATKDALAGLYPGMALVLLAWRFGHLRGRASYELPRPTPGYAEVPEVRPAPRIAAAAFRAAAQVHWVAGVALFAGVCLFVNGALHNPSAYWARLQYWIDPPPGSLHARQIRYPAHLDLLWATVRYAASAVGWPMLAALGAACLHALWRNTRMALATLVPAATYYVVVIERIDFVYSRFLFAPLALGCILVGIAASELWRRHRVPRLLATLVLLGVLLPSIAYAAAVDAEIIRDCRYAAEQWFVENVPRSASVGAFSADYEPRVRPHYLPRLHELGYPTYPVVMAHDWFARQQPEYLVLSSATYEDFDAEQTACMGALLSGALGYTAVADFHGAYLNGQSWLSIAGLGTPPIGKISPTIIVLRREPQP
ncbi:MAG: glycosyltransferase family 39 protein [Planctomycetes bacterium]|nr:glycosyltransferase family 39 protein [Planctomycetota bacterium]